MFGNNDGKKSPFMTWNQNVTSYNQSGGITAHTVNNFAPPDRHLNDRDRQNLLARVPAGSVVQVSIAFGDGEAAVFGQEILDFLIAHGRIGHPDGLGHSVWDRPLRGQTLFPDEDGTIQIQVGHRP